MQSTPEELLYEYAVIRFVPRVEREEFINIGLVMMCKRRKWVRLAYELDPRRMAAFNTSVRMSDLEAQLESMERIANGLRDAGDIAMLPAEERFRWLTATRSACLQTSRPHPGLCSDPDDTFNRIYADMVAVQQNLAPA